jgi:glycosyltransferase involved in cell wall biosynthesis
LADEAVVTAPAAPEQDRALAAPFGTIGVVLPARETFGLLKSGAVALCARDFAAHSRFRDSITILGSAVCEYPDVRYRRLVDWRRWYLRGRTAYVRAVIRAAEEDGFAVLEIQNRPQFVAALHRGLPGVKLTLHLHNDPQDMEGSRSPAERQALLQRVDAVYCVSAFVLRQFLSGVRDDAGKAIVVYNGVAAGAAAAPKEKVFAFAGRLIRDKGVAELTQAFAIAAPDLPGWRLVIAGEDSAKLFAGRRAPLAQARDALGERLTLLGQVSHADAMALFGRAEIAVVPSIWQEPFGRTAVEAMGQGCAVIATCAGGLAEVVDGAGEIIDARDIPAFAAALRRVALDEPLRRRLQEKARTRAQEVFDIRRVTESLDAARARLLTKR